MYGYSHIRLIKTQHVAMYIHLIVNYTLLNKISLVSLRVLSEPRCV
jgi:hypothetical protein